MFLQNTYKNTLQILHNLQHNIKSTNTSLNYFTLPTYNTQLTTYDITYLHVQTLHKTRRLKAIPWDALARERCIGMNYEATVKCND